MLPAQARRNASTLIIDSRDRTGPLSYDNFSVTVSPAMAGATNVRLLFASIGVPLASNEPYYLIRCPQLGIGVRSAAGSSGTTFIIPVNSQPSYRSLFGSQNEFLYSANLQQPADDISRLDFQILKYGGAAAGMTENSYYVIELSYD